MSTLVAISLTTGILSGTYYLDQHTITAGFEYEKLEVFNQFVQHTEGEWRFADQGSRYLRI